MLLRLLWVVFYTALGVFLIIFMAMNRTSVSVRVLPLTERLEMPLFAALSAMFVLGLLIGLSVAAVQALIHTRRHRRQARAIAQLEKELSHKITSQA